MPEVPPGVLDVRPPAQVDEARAAAERRMLLRLGRRVLVGAYGAGATGCRHRIGRGVGDDLELQGMVGEDLAGVVGRDLVTQERLLLVDDLTHARVDALEVFRCEGGAARQLEVVVEAVLDRWADAEGRVREQIEDRLGQYVGRRMADRVEPTRAVGGDYGHAVAVVELGGQVTLLAVDLGDHRRLRESCPDGTGEIGRSGARRQRARRSIGQGDLDLGHECRGYRPPLAAPESVWAVPAGGRAAPSASPLPPLVRTAGGCDGSASGFRVAYSST